MSKVNKILFIIPYFGKFNNYFQLFLNSCERNSDLCNWIIFTNDKTQYKFPSNVEVVYMKWGTICSLLKRKLGDDIECSYPYKLCDYRPAYGYVFEDYIKNYKYWGYCDTDIIWGKISEFVNLEMLKVYDKIFDLGHCTIYKNDIKVNKAFLLPLSGEKRYKYVFSQKNNCSFDEEYKLSINNIFLENHFKIFDKSFAANTYTKSSFFRLVSMNGDKKSYSVEKLKKSFFLWDNGHIKRYILYKNSYEIQEYLYIHFQSRPMKVNINNLDTKIFKMIPNAFENLEIEEINLKKINNIKTFNINFHYFKLRLKNLIIKFNRLVKK